MNELFLMLSYTSIHAEKRELGVLADEGGHIVISGVVLTHCLQTQDKSM